MQNFQCGKCSTTFTKNNMLYDHQIMEHSFCMTCKVRLYDKNVKRHNDIHNPCIVKLQRLSEYEIFIFTFPDPNMLNHTVVKLEGEDLLVDVDNISHHRNMTLSPIAENLSENIDLTDFLQSKLKKFISTLKEESELDSLCLENNHIPVTQKTADQNTQLDETKLMQLTSVQSSQLKPLTELTKKNNFKVIESNSSNCHVEIGNNQLNSSLSNICENNLNKPTTSKYPGVVRKSPNAVMHDILLCNNSHQLYPNSSNSEIINPQFNALNSVKLEKHVRDQLNSERTRLLRLNDDFHERVNSNNKMYSSKTTTVPELCTAAVENLRLRQYMYEADKNRLRILDKEFHPTFTFEMPQLHPSHKISQNKPEEPNPEYYEKEIRGSEVDPSSQIIREIERKPERMRLLRLKPDFQKPENAAWEMRRSLVPDYCKRENESCQMRRSEQDQREKEAKRKRLMRLNPEFHVTEKTDHQLRILKLNQSLKEAEHVQLLRLNSECPERENVTQTIKPELYQTDKKADHMQLLSLNLECCERENVTQKIKPELYQTDKKADHMQLLRLNSECPERENDAKKIKSELDQREKEAEVENLRLRQYMHEAEKNQFQVSDNEFHLVTKSQNKPTCTFELPQLHLGSEMLQLHPSCQISQIKQEEPNTEYCEREIRRKEVDPSSEITRQRERKADYIRLLRLNPEFRKKEKETRERRRKLDPEFRKRQNAARQTRRLDPEYRKRENEARQIRRSNQDQREKENQRKRWLRLNPEYRKKENEARQMRRSNQDQKAEHMHLLSLNSECRKRENATQKTKSELDQTEKEAEHMQLLSSNPECHERVNAAQKIRSELDQTEKAAEHMSLNSECCKRENVAQKIKSELGETEIEAEHMQLLNLNSECHERVNASQKIRSELDQTEKEVEHMQLLNLSSECRELENDAQKIKPELDQIGKEAEHMQLLSLNSMCLERENAIQKIKSELDQPDKEADYMQLLRLNSECPERENAAKKLKSELDQREKKAEVEKLRLKQYMYEAEKKQFQASDNEFHQVVTKSENKPTCTLDLPQLHLGSEMLQLHPNCQISKIKQEEPNPEYCEKEIRRTEVDPSLEIIRQRERKADYIRLLRLNPEFRKKEKETRERRRKLDPEFRKRQNAARQTRRLDPEYRKRENEARQIRRSNQDQREKENQRKRWLRLNPEYRKKENEARQMRRSNQDQKEKEAEHMHLLSLNLECRERVNATQKLRSELDQTEKEAEHMQLLSLNSECLERENATQKLTSELCPLEKEAEHVQLLSLNPECGERESVAKKIRRPELDQREKEAERKRFLRLNPLYRKREKDAVKITPELDQSVKEGEQKEAERTQFFRRQLMLGPILHYRIRSNIRRQKKRKAKVMNKEFKSSNLVSSEVENVTRQPDSKNVIDLNWEPICSFNMSRLEPLTDMDCDINSEVPILEPEQCKPDILVESCNATVEPILAESDFLSNEIIQDLKAPSTKDTGLNKNVSLLKPNFKNKSSSGFICDECNESFSTYSTLRKHIITHLGGRPFQCNKCKIVFTWKESLNSHKCKAPNFSTT